MRSRSRSVRPGRAVPPGGRRQAAPRVREAAAPPHRLGQGHALRPLFAYLRAVVVPTAVYAASEDWGSGGDEYTEGLPARIRRAGGELATLMAARPAEETPDDDITALERQLSDLRFD
jgi:FMN reductase